MAKLPRRRARRLAPAAAVLVVLVAAAGAAAAAPVDLLGSWHVLIHYTDENTHDPSLMRWDDKLWRFELAGSRLRWTEYPIVVFGDQTGRFENLGGTHAARVVHGWEPNAAQSAQIAAGLEVNPRGSKSKTLRHDGDSWRSLNRPSASSAMVVTYVESWSIERASGLPIFRREDTLGSAATESYDGVTEYTTTAVESGGDVLRGTFERDGTRHGTFRMTRSGTAQAVAGTAKSEGRRFYEKFLGEEFRAAFASPDGAVARAAAAVPAGGGAAAGAARDAVRAAVRSALEAGIRAADEDPGAYEREVASLTGKISAEIVDAGASPAQVERMLAEGEINP